MQQKDEKLVSASTNWIYITVAEIKTLLIINNFPQTSFYHDWISINNQPIEALINSGYKLNTTYS